MTSAKPDSWHITNVNIAGERGVVRGGLTVADGRIAALHADGEREPGPPAGAPTIDGGGGWLLPGFIDVHVHGGHGGDFMDADPSSYDSITRFHAAGGTTAMLATTVTAAKTAIDRTLAAVEAYRRQPMPGAKLLGVHLEGPFISAKWPGAQNPAFIVEPRLDWLREWDARHPGLIRLVTLAPERPGATEALAWLAERGIVASCGHTDASYDAIRHAVGAGLRHAAHTYNAMRGFHHREPGTVGAVLACDELSAEVIADGHHAHPAAVRLLRRAKPADKLLLITDAIAAAGLADGDYELGGLAVTVSEGVARLKEGGSLAGSTLTMLGAFRFMLEQCGLTPAEASRMASANPARLLGIDDRTGTIAPGLAADLVWLDERFGHIRTWVDGVPVADRGSRS